MNESQIERAVTVLLSEIEPSEYLREGLRDTPNRVARMYKEIFAGYEQDPAKFLKRKFDAEKCDQLVIVKDIPFYSHCEHHIVPFFGVCHIGYLPKTYVAGLSKFARVTEAFARRLQIQERLTSQIANCIQDNLDCKGCIVVMEAEHLCMTMRGVQKPGSKTITSHVTGYFLEQDTLKNEFFNALKIGK
jgi:GTP cyclohydrolase I